MGTNLLMIFYVLPLAISSPFARSKFNSLTRGSSISVEKPGDVLTSRNGVFSAGFFPVGVNAYCFAVWFNEASPKDNGTVVWMANRDKPVNGKSSKLTLREAGLILSDAGRSTVWTVGPFLLKPAQLRLNDSGNIVLLTLDGVVLWQSFDSPTDTILTNEPFTRKVRLVSSRSQSNFSSGFYEFFFDGYDVLRLSYENNALSSVYWPSQWDTPWDVGRVAYNHSTFAWLDPLGYFDSSDKLEFMSEDYGSSLIQRRLTLDYDGNIRLYSRQNFGDSWVVSWQAFHNPCKIHGICGPNSLCTYDRNIGRQCSCLPGHKMTNRDDWSHGCEPDFNLACNSSESRFLTLSNTEFYGYDLFSIPNSTFMDCQNLCLQRCECKGFEYSFSHGEGFYCYAKTSLANGYEVPSYSGDMYMRLPKNYQLSHEEYKLNCSDQVIKQAEIKSYENESVKFILWFVIGLGGVEIISILLVWCLLIRTQKNAVTNARSHVLATSKFRRFSFAELKKATWGFSQEIGRGSEGTVYKGMLSDSRVAAVKRLNEAPRQGEAEFLAELSTIGRLNHMNLIEMWGYCVEGNRRLLVYEYLEHGSLKENLTSNVLDWKKRYEIAVGTAKGLAYLHEECLEWILHCDVKPQNILLTSNYQPKVADFGLSKLLKRGELYKPSFSRIRGTRGYMAPEWVTNQSITSKVDVYSYGVVVLEILTGKSPTTINGTEETEHRGLVKWAKDMVTDGSSKTTSWVEKIVDPAMEGEYDVEKMENLLRAALACVGEDKIARPTMSQVVKVLLHHENYH